MVLLLGRRAGVWAALVPQSGQAAHKGRKKGRHGSRLLLIRLIIGSKRLKARFTFDNRNGLIGCTRLHLMRQSGNKSRQGECIARLAAKEKAMPILIQLAL